MSWPLMGLCISTRDPIDNDHFLPNAIFGDDVWNAHKSIKGMKITDVFYKQDVISHLSCACTI